MTNLKYDRPEIYDENIMEKNLNENLGEMSPTAVSPLMVVFVVGGGVTVAGAAFVVGGAVGWTVAVGTHKVTSS